MTDYLLFIDTEASGLPKRWDVPYAKKGNWPHAVQLAWVIFTKDGNEVKQQNYYINDNDFTVSKSATKVHGITSGFLQNNGTGRTEVMTSLASDIHHYQPLVVGHFMEFDYHITSAEFYRAGIQNPLQHVYTFCIMLSTKHMIEHPVKKYLKLNELYQLLFGKPLQNHHDAIVDARATAACFFGLMKQGKLDEDKVEQQKIKFQPIDEARSKPGCSLMLAIFILALLITMFYE